MFPPGELVELAAQQNQALREVRVWQATLTVDGARLGVNLPQGRLPVEAGALIENAGMKDQPLGVGGWVVRVAADNLVGERGAQLVRNRVGTGRVRLLEGREGQQQGEQHQGEEDEARVGRAVGCHSDGHFNPSQKKRLG